MTDRPSTHQCGLPDSQQPARDFSGSNSRCPYHSAQLNDKIIGTDTAPSDASITSDGHTNDHSQGDTNIDGTDASDATTSSETTEIDLQGVAPNTYPNDLVENGARWLLWQYSDDRKVPRNPAWRYSDHGAGYAFAGAKDPRAWFEFDKTTG